jgi:hypothetical protein
MGPIGSIRTVPRAVTPPTQTRYEGVCTMKQRVATTISIGLCLFLTCAAVGCGKARQTSPTAPNQQPASTNAHGDEDEDAGHAHVAALPQDLSSGIAALQEHYRAIKGAFEQGDTQKAHEPLHDVGGVLEVLPKLVQATGLAAADAKKANQSADKMFEAYSRIDEALHQGKPADYKAVAGVLDENMAVISAVLATTPQTQK